MPHATLEKFGFPGMLIRQGDHWALLVRPRQVTLGSLVLCSLSEARSYGELPVEAFAEQRDMVALAERLLSRFVRFERINYLMLMMVDPHVHFHIIPRYQGVRDFGGESFPDSGWPGVPDLATSLPAPDTLVDRLRSAAAAET